MTADVRRPLGFRAFAAACKHAVLMNSLIDGGRTTRHCPPPVGLQSLLLKLQPFSLRRTREVVPQHTLQNVLLRLPSPPPPLPAEFPKTGTWQDGGGYT